MRGDGLVSKLVMSSPVGSGYPKGLQAVHRGDDRVQRRGDPFPIRLPGELQPRDRRLWPPVGPTAPQLDSALLGDDYVIGPARGVRQPRDVFVAVPRLIPPRRDLYG